jgi:uncharacterized spore protein YtfJ
MDNNDFERTVQSLFGGMNEFVTSKTVVGDPIHVGDTIILPLVDVTFGVGAGTSTNAKSPNAGGGLGGKVTALAVNIETYPTHIAGLPVAVNICCHVNRHISVMI